MLYVLRHGQSVWNFENKFTGWTDVELNKNGIKEAENVGKIVKDLNINYVFTSNLKRTIQTAEIIQKYINNPNLITINNEALNERNYGIFTNAWHGRL